jgi:hypothetical protein
MIPVLLRGFLMYLCATLTLYSLPDFISSTVPVLNNQVVTNTDIPANKINGMIIEIKNGAMANETVSVGIVQ